MTEPWRVHGRCNDLTGELLGIEYLYSQNGRILPPVNLDDENELDDDDDEGFLSEEDEDEEDDDLTIERPRDNPTLQRRVTRTPTASPQKNPPMSDPLRTPPASPTKNLLPMSPRRSPRKADPVDVSSARTRLWSSPPRPHRQVITHEYVLL